MGFTEETLESEVVLEEGGFGGGVFVLRAGVAGVSFRLFGGGSDGGED